LIDQTLMEDIRTDPFLDYMHKDVVKFDKYLDSTSTCTFGMKGLCYDPNYLNEAPDPVYYERPYVHRWTIDYDHLQLWRLYNLQWYFCLNPEKNPKYTMMVTLTGSHASPKTPQKGGLHHIAYLGKFHEAHQKSKDQLRKYLKTDRYLAMLEGHPESGYVHAHDLYFLDEYPPEKTFAILENHWNNTLGMGSAEHGIKIELKEPHEFRDIKSFIAYPMSYIGKTSIGALSEWTKYDVIFNTCLWLSPRPKLLGGIGHRVRAFQPSRPLSKIMNPHKSEGGYCHIETVLSRKKRNDPTVMYQAPSYDVNIKAWEKLGGDSKPA